MAVSVLEAARLTDTSEQNLHQAINRGTLPAYQWVGRRMILLDDLVESPAARKQAERLAEESFDRREAEYRHRNPWPAWMWPEGEPQCPPDCPVCLEGEPTDGPKESSS
jgi:hypothetical protein